jgi:MGT family glycosyltransferase
VLTTVPRRRVVVFCMPQQGHVQRTLPVIEALHAGGHVVHVFTGAQYAAAVTAVGGRFEDLFLEGPLEAIDATSIPRPSRYVTFAAHRAKPVAQRVAALRPALLVYDTFAVIARVIADMLGLPAVNVCAGHAMVPSRMRRALRVDTQVQTSQPCHDAVTVLRDVYGLPNASPFSFVDGVSAHLNLYAEPPQFLPVIDRPEFAPLAFFGSLRAALAHTAPPARQAPARRIRRVFASFGSVVWHYFPERVESRLRSLAGGLSRLGVELLVSTGGESLTPATHEALLAAGARVERWVDQRAVLAETDLFVTHQGLNSTHEAIWHRVPMLSLPFFSDQPALAARCEALGLALPLGGADAETVPEALLAAQLRTFEHDAEAFAARLSEAHRWERDVIAARPTIVARMLALA